MEYVNLGKKIKEERLRHGYTQEELGEVVDTSGSYIGQIERCERNASMIKIIAISEALNVSIDYLIGNIESNYNEHINDNIVKELQNTTSNQKEMLIEIIKIIKKYK